MSVINAEVEQRVGGMLSAGKTCWGIFYATQSGVYGQAVAGTRFNYRARTRIIFIVDVRLCERHLVFARICATIAKILPLRSFKTAETRKRKCFFVYRCPGFQLRKKVKAISFSFLTKPKFSPFHLK